MKIDRTLAKEIRSLNGDGGRESKFAALKKIRAAAEDLSSENVMSTFTDCIRKHGRAVVAVCIAATLQYRGWRIDRWGYEWATEVLKCFTSRTPSFLEFAHIQDGLHPTRICEYAGDFIKLTTEE